jgi:hypothetical protein
VTIAKTDEAANETVHRWLSMLRARLAICFGYHRSGDDVFTSACCKAVGALSPSTRRAQIAPADHIDQKIDRDCQRKDEYQQPVHVSDVE